MPLLGRAASDYTSFIKANSVNSGDDRVLVPRGSGSLALYSFVSPFRRTRAVTVTPPYSIKNSFYRYIDTTSIPNVYMTTDIQNNVYTMQNNTIQKYNSSGQLIFNRTYLTPGEGNRFSFTVDPVTGNFYLPNQYEGTLDVRTPEGVEQSFFQLSGQYADYCAIGTDRNLYVSDNNYAAGYESIYKTPISTPNNTTTLSIARPISYIVLDSSNNIYFVSNNTICKYDQTLQSNNISVLYQNPNTITGLVIDSFQNLIFLDATALKIKKLNSDRSVTDIVSNLVSPVGLAIDINNNIYITENNSTATTEIFKILF